MQQGRRWGIFSLVLAAVLAFALPANASLYKIKQSSTAYPLLFTMSDTSGAAVTGIVPVVTISKSGAAFGAPAGAISEIGSGWYKVAGNATDEGTLGPLALHATGAGALASDVMYEVVAYDPQDSAGLGLSRVDAAISSRSTYAGADTSGTTTLLTRIPGVVQPQTGDSFARLGVGGAGLTALGDTRFGFLTGDAYARIGAAGAGLTALGDARVANLDATVSSRIPTAAMPPNWSALAISGGGVVQSLVAGYSAGQDPATVLKAMLVDGTFTWGQANTVALAIAAEGTRTFNGATHTAVSTYYRRVSGGTGPDLTKPVMTKTTVYDASNTQPQSQSIVFSNLP